MGRRFRCAVVGAANIDIGGFPQGRIALQDSNPGRVLLSPGGVGRNIACNLARLGVETHLVAPLGTDAFTGILRADCARAGVDTRLCFTFPGAASSAYLFIADINGDMQLAVNDMDICRRMTPEALAGRIDALNAMDAVVLDANLPEASIAFLAERLRPPLFADAVSAAKARRLLPALPRLHEAGGDGRGGGLRHPGRTGRVLRRPDDDPLHGRNAGADDQRHRRRRRLHRSPGLGHAQSF